MHVVMQAFSYTGPLSIPKMHIFIRGKKKKIIIIKPWNITFSYSPQDFILNRRGKCNQVI